MTARICVILVLWAAASSGCLRDLSKCDTADDCFAGESCEEGGCAPVPVEIVSEPTAAPAGPVELDSDVDWVGEAILGSIDMVVEDDGTPHLLFEDRSADAIRHITWDGFRWIDFVVADDVVLSDFDQLRVDASPDGVHALLSRQGGVLEFATFDEGAWSSERIVTDFEGRVPFGSDLTVDLDGTPYICLSLVNLETVDTDEFSPLRLLTRVEGAWETIDPGTRGLPGCTITVSDQSALVHAFHTRIDVQVGIAYVTHTELPIAPVGAPVVTDLELEGEVISAGSAGLSTGAPVVAFSRFDGVRDDLVVATRSTSGWNSRSVHRTAEGRFITEMRVHSHYEAPGLHEIVFETASLDGSDLESYYLALWGSRGTLERVDQDGEVDWFDIGLDLDGARHPFYLTLSGHVVYGGPL